MNEYKKRMKQLKGPDAFQAKAMGGIDYLMKHQKIVLAVVGTIIVLAGAIGGGILYKDYQAKSRREALAPAEVQYDKEIETATKERDELKKELAKVNDQIAKASKPAAKGETKAGDKKGQAEKEATAAVDPALKAKAADLQTKVEKIKPDHSQSAALYKSYFDKHDDSPEGWYAGTRYASFLVDDKKYDEAKGVLEKILQASKSNSFYQTQTRMMLVATYENLKQYDDALGQLDKLIQTSAADLKPKLLLAKGELLASKNDKAGAKSTLESVIKDHGDSPEAAKARGVLALLD